MTGVQTCALPISRGQAASTNSRGSTGLLAGKLAEVPALLDAYMSYRGITAAGLAAAEAAGFEQAIRSALSAAMAKAEAMAAT